MKETFNFESKLSKENEPEEILEQIPILQEMLERRKQELSRIIKDNETFAKREELEKEIVELEEEIAGRKEAEQ